jgi:hypothetical protein
VSVYVSDQVWKHTIHSGSPLVVLLGLADWSDDEGCSYPGLAALARKARLDERQLRRHIDRLKASGELEVHLGMGPPKQGGRTNLYRIRVGALKDEEGVNTPPGELTPGGRKRHRREGESDREGGVKSPPNTSGNRQQDTQNVRASDVDLGKMPQGLDESTWRDFLEVLRVKGKAPTPTYIASLADAGKAANMSMPDLIRMMTSKGWASFDASWVRGELSQPADATIDLATKGGIERAARELQMQQRADEQWPQFGERVRQAWAERKGIAT